MEQGETGNGDEGNIYTQSNLYLETLISSNTFQPLW